MGTCHGALDSFKTAAYKIGSVPFQLMAASFHLVLMQFSRGGTMGGSPMSSSKSVEKEKIMNVSFFTDDNV